MSTPARTSSPCRSRPTGSARQNQCASSAGTSSPYPLPRCSAASRASITGRTSAHSRASTCPGRMAQTPLPTSTTTAPAPVTHLTAVIPRPPRSPPQV
ncbi:hypothetical protein ACFQ3Z_21410 [Streptomyces nogalater]